jgi:hypothetical protein
MTTRLLLDDLTLVLDDSALAKRLRINTDSSFALKLKKLAAEARSLGRPKALVRTAYVEARGEGHLVLDGVRLNSRVLRINLDEVHRAFPFVATCGRELAAWAENRPQGLERFWAEEICASALFEALTAVKQRLENLHGINQLSHMSPGSLPDWPLAEQPALFALLGRPDLDIGVELTGSLLMRPLKSVSGIMFAARETFHSCQLCPRDQCPGRRAPYDQHLLQTRFGEDGEN